MSIAQPKLIMVKMTTHKNIEANDYYKNTYTPSFYFKLNALYIVKLRVYLINKVSFTMCYTQ